MDWQQILYLAVTVLIGTVLPPLAFMFLNWLKSQKWVQKAHLEGFFEAMVPQVVQWVDYWASQLAKDGVKPSGAVKMAKFRELLKAELPANAKMTDEQLALRAEAELQKLKNSLNNT